MLGLGWTEMLVLGIAALIFIGPKDLPVVMNRAGKILGQIRRMGSDFQREINKSTGLDEVRNLRNAITSPLKKTSEEIRKEFNAMTPTGPKPSGVIKPADPKAESVVDEINAAAGITKPRTADEAAKAYGFKPTATKADTAAKPARKPAAKKAPAKAKAPVKANAAPTSAVATTDLDPIPAKPAPAKKPAARKAAAAVAAAPAAAPETTAKPAPRKRAPAKPKAAAKPATKAENE